MKTDAQKLKAIEELIATDGNELTDGEVIDGIADILKEEREIDTGINEGLKQVFLDDCSEIYGLTDEQALDEWDIYGEDFICKQVDELWNNWSENFPNVEEE